jgi:hypothetical protein
MVTVGTYLTNTVSQGHDFTGTMMCEQNESQRYKHIAKFT